MNRFATLSATVFFALIAAGSCLLPCNSQLRLLPQFASRFTHCQCSYSQWSEWTPVSSSIVPTSQCPSGRALREEREQRVLSGQNCNERSEHRTVCEPELIDQLILGLGLGSSGQQITPTNSNLRPFTIQPITIQPFTIFNQTAIGNQPTRGKRSTCEAGQICQHVTTPHGKRSVLEEKRRPNLRKLRRSASPEPLAVDPIPFNIAEHGARYRRQTNCLPNGMQHILFVLDTSGSISETTFNSVTEALSDLIVFFCNPIKVAVMTFDHEYYVEFCFNCYDNTCGGRVGTREAMRNVDYDFNRSGTRYTHTGGATQCVCDFMLTQTCGLDPTANCIDVVYLTDGRSNDPNRNVCEDIRCLHNRFGVTTYAIGIEHELQSELDCITDADPGEYHLFNFDTFAEFLQAFQDLVEILFNGGVSSNGDPYVCIGTQGVGTQACQ